MPSPYPARKRAVFSAASFSTPNIADPYGALSDADHATRYGTAVAGNLPWKNQQLYEIAKRARDVTSGGYHKLPTRIAPRNPLQKSVTDKANTLINAANADTYDLAKQEIKGSFDKRHLDELLPKVKNVARPSMHLDNVSLFHKFDERYSHMNKAIMDEMSEHYLRKVAPNVNYSFMNQGLWNSPLRNKHQNDVIAELQKNMARELQKTRHMAFEKGLEEVGHQSHRQLQSAQLAGELVDREKQQSNVGAQNLQRLEQSKLIDQLSRMDATRQAGNEQQAQHEAELAENQQHHIAQQEHPLKMLQHEISAAHGTPAPLHFNPSKAPENLRTNMAATGANMLGTLAASQMFNHKSGGLVGYAPGGFVLPQYQMTPQDMQMQQQVVAMHNHNPQQALMHAIATSGAQTARRYGQTAFSDIAADTHLAHQQAHQAQKERAINLMQKIQESRMNQQQVIAVFEQRQKEFEENQKHHGATLAETRRHHQAIEGNVLGKAEKKANADRTVTVGGKIFKSQQKLGLSPQDQMQSRKNDEALAKLESREAPYDETLEFLDSTTPSTGWIAEHTPDISDKARQYQRNLSSMVSSVVAPGVMTKAKLDFAKQQKPSQMDSPQAVREFAQKGKEVIGEDKEPLMMAQQYRTYGIPDRITIGAYNAWIKNDKQGDFNDYLQAVLEGGEIPHPEKHSETADSIMDNPNLSMAQKRTKLAVIAHG